MLLLFSSCVKQVPEAIPQLKGKLKDLTLNGRVIRTYYYDSTIRMSHYITVDSLGIKLSENTLHYDVLNRLIKEDLVTTIGVTVPGQWDSVYTSFAYDGNNNMVEAKLYRKGVNGVFNYTGKRTLAYDGQNRPIEQHLYGGTNGLVLLTRSTYVYDANDNVVTESAYFYNSTGTYVVSTSNLVYEYDDKKNPMINLVLLPGGVSKNNCTKRTVTNFNNSNPNNQTINVRIFVYAGYNADGYPLNYTDSELPASTFGYAYYP